MVVLLYNITWLMLSYACETIIYLFRSYFPFLHYHDNICQWHTIYLSTERNEKGNVLTISDRTKDTTTNSAQLLPLNREMHSSTTIVVTNTLPLYVENFLELLYNYRCWWTSTTNTNTNTTFPRSYLLDFYCFLQFSLVFNFIWTTLTSNFKFFWRI